VGCLTRCLEIWYAFCCVFTNSLEPHKRKGCVNQVFCKSRLCAGTGRHDIVITSAGERDAAEDDTTAGRPRCSRSATRHSNSTDTHTDLLMTPLQWQLDMMHQKTVSEANWSRILTKCSEFMDHSLCPTCF